MEGLALNAYYFGNLTYVSQWGVSSRSVTDGALKVTFNSKRVFDTLFSP